MDEAALRRFRRLDLAGKRAWLAARLGPDGAGGLAATAVTGELGDLVDLMVENAVGAYPVPLGVATGLLVDGVEHLVPMATEEPSVIAAASHGARLAAAGGGFAAWAGPPVMTACVYLEGVPAAVAANADKTVAAVRAELDGRLRDALPSLYRRGGGLVGFAATPIADTPALSGVLRLDLDVDVRNAMGANLVNTAAEAAKPLLARAFGGTPLLCILTNAAPRRTCGARCAVPVKLLARGGFTGEETAARVARVAAVAAADPWRAVTHNKGIMNGISALALATGNDTRGVEAAAHGHAARGGTIAPLSTWTVDGDVLRGELELPLPLGTVGGAVGLHPASRLALALLGDPDAPGLGRVAAALGLAQNLAALAALATEGIQHGHMRLHAARVAWQAGARGPEIAAVAESLWRANRVSSTAAVETLAALRAGRGEGA